MILLLLIIRKNIYRKKEGYILNATIYKEFRKLSWLRIDRDCMRVLYLPSINYLREQLIGTDFETDQTSLLMTNIKDYRRGDWAFVKYDGLELLDLSLENVSELLDLYVYQYDPIDNTIILVRDLNESFL